MFRQVMSFLFILLLVLLGNAKAYSSILISEILADPPVGLAGDANGDGVGSSNTDEFIELFNADDSTVDLSGWSLSDATKIRHTFVVNFSMLPKQIWVIFGGGNPQLSDINWQIATTGTLSLNNAGDTVTLYDKNNQVIDQMPYGSEADNDQSIVRFPEGSDSAMIQHLSLPNADGRRYSPGYFVNNPTSTAAVPEIATLGYLSIAMPFMLFVKKIKWN